jgi:hypothetical protein
LFHCTLTFPLSHPIGPNFSSRVTCTLCRWAYNFSKVVKYTLRNKAQVMFLCVIMSKFLLPEYLLNWLNWSQSRLYISSWA